MHRIRLGEFLDKVMLLGAMLLFALVGVSALFQVRRLDRLASQGRPMLSEMTVNAPRLESEPPEGLTVVWSPPPSQSRGEDWVFDVFTPPVIYYDPDSREFAVTPPSRPSDDAGASEWDVVELELLEVRLRPYRLQLVGYAGAPGSYVAYFEDVSTGRLVLLREGEEHPQLGVRLLAFEERQVAVEAANSMPVRQQVGVARLLDAGSDQEISLTNLETKMFSDLEAQVRLLPSGEVQRVKQGSRIELESADYVIGDLSVQPEEAMITKVSKDGARRFTRVLAPSSRHQALPQGPSRPPADSPFSIRPRSSGSRPDG